MITVMDIDGLQPQDPSDLNNQLITLVASEVPGYTADLPGSLVEDLSGTGTGVLALCDQARVELVNSITPYGANQFLLNQLGVQKGLRPGLPTNTSVYLVFTGTPGFAIPQGFTVSDGTNQVVLQETTVIPASGKTTQVFAVANNSGSFAMPRLTVTQIVSSYPAGITLSVSNPADAFPSTGAESVDSYRARVLDAESAVAQGMPTTVKTALRDVVGVQARLVSMLQQPGGGWSIICGGGDPYAIANAIYLSVFDVSTLVGSSISSSRNVTVTVMDSPDQYNIPFITPPAQQVGVTVAWNTNATNAVADDTVTQAIQPAVLNYINSVVVGQPINTLHLNNLIQTAVQNIVPIENLSNLAYTFTINGTQVPTAELIAGDPESYFITTLAQIAVTRG